MTVVITSVPPPWSGGCQLFKIQNVLLINDRTFLHFFWIHVSLHLEVLGVVSRDHPPSHASGDYHLDDGFLSLVLGSYPLTIMCQWSLMSYSGSETRGWPRHQHNNGPTRIRFLITPLLLALWAKHRIRLRGVCGGGGGGGNWCTQ